MVDPQDHGMWMKRAALWRLSLLVYFALALWTWLVEWQGIFLVWMFFGPPAFFIETLLLPMPRGWPFPVWAFVAVLAVQASALMLVRRWRAREGTRGRVARWLRVPLLVTMALIAIGCAIDLVF
jgi:hypothetical protein